MATRLVLICNPNNPTSTAHGLDAIEDFLRRVPRHVCVILDEAYCEYSLALGDTYASVELLRRYTNLVLLRTFSKVYGLAGLRVGYGLCGSPEFRGAVDQVRQPFFVNASAQAAAVEALRHQHEVERRVAHTIAVRWRRAYASWGCGSPSQTRTSSGSTCPARRTKATWSPVCVSAASSSAPATPSGAPARCA